MADSLTPSERIAAVMASLNLTVSAVFVPFRASRNADSGTPSLNWRVTVERDGRAILATDYSAGCAHAPSYGTKPPRIWRETERAWQSKAVAFECEVGARAVASMLYSGPFAPNGGKPIMPDPVAVIWSLSQDASVLDAGGFEAWASEYGYDPDSRAAERTYNACLEIALKLRGAIGDAGIDALRTAGEDY